MTRISATTLVLGLIAASAAFAQTTPPATTMPTATPPSSSTMPPAVATSGANTTTAAPVAGANSFTMAQAQKRIEDQGYVEVTALAKDAQSVWRGQAMKDGKAVSVALDYQGNITSN